MSEENKETTNTENVETNTETAQVNPAETKQETVETKPAENTTETKEPELTIESYGDLGLVDNDDVQVDKEYVNALKGVALKHKVPVDVLKELVGVQYAEAKKVSDSAAQIKKEWAAEISKTYGDNLKNVETNCGRVLAQFDKEGKFKELLSLVGADNAPATLAFLKSIGDVVLEKASVNSATIPNKEKTLEDFYKK